MPDTDPAFPETVDASGSALDVADDRSVTTDEPTTDEPTRGDDPVTSDEPLGTGIDLPAAGGGDDATIGGGGGGRDDVTTGGGDEGTARNRPRIDKGLLIACFVIACGLALIIWGVGSAITGDDGVDRPDEIEGVSPVENAVQVLQQDRVEVDLQFGFEAVLIIDGIEIPTTRLGESDQELEPGQQVTTDPTTAQFDPGNGRITFQPTEGALIETFDEGRHTAQVVYWRIEESRETDARTYRWSFNVI